MCSVRCLQAAFPERSLPDGEEHPSELKVDNSKAKELLGLETTPLQETFVDMARTMLSLGIV